MKKLVSIALAGAMTLTIGCSKTNAKVEPQTYTAYGRYYTDGTVITNDGHKWGYHTNLISNRTPTDNMPIWIGFSDNGTPDNIKDDIILGVVYDVNTAIYDSLESTLSEQYDVERNGNYIRIEELRNGGIKK